MADAKRSAHHPSQAAVDKGHRPHAAHGHAALVLPVGEQGGAGAVAVVVDTASELPALVGERPALRDLTAQHIHLVQAVVGEGKMAPILVEIAGVGMGSPRRQAEACAGLEVDADQLGDAVEVSTTEYKAAVGRQEALVEVGACQWYVGEELDDGAAGE